MLEIRTDEKIHREEGGWFSARWHFSFDHYRDPNQMGLGPLRVFNDDRLVAGAIWPMHPHQDVEGITYVVEGKFRHEDSAGGDGVFSEGAVQRMTLGRGAYHSEQNGSEDEPMRFLQFWLLPDTPSLEPGVEQRQYTPAMFKDQLRKVLGPEGGDVVKVHQDASAYIGLLSPRVVEMYRVPDGRGAYVYLIDGAATFDAHEVTTGAAAKVIGPHDLRIEGVQDAHVIVVDVPLEFERVGIWAGRTR